MVQNELKVALIHLSNIYYDEFADVTALLRAWDLSGLRTLELSFCIFWVDPNPSIPCQGHAVKEVCDAIAVECPNLQELSFDYYCQLSDQDDHPYEALFNSSSIRKLTIYLYAFQLQQEDSFVNLQLANLTGLQELTVDNKIGLRSATQRLCLGIESDSLVKLTVLSARL